MNSCNFTGRITADLELRKTQSDKSVVSFSLAVARPRVKDTTDFINFVAWNQSAEYLCKYGHKGDMVEVSGVLTTRKYEDGNGNKRTVFEVVADSVKLLSNGNQNAPTQIPCQDTKSQNSPYSVNGGGIEFEEQTPDDDLPF